MFPGDARSDPYDYDPRVRPWYVVIVIDTSGSMAINNLMERAEAAADMVVKLLVIADF